MKKFKPFLIGAIAGSILMFVSLQFHLIRSEGGFRLVPRTPQPSLGLFFVDLRNWTPEDYADRPEVARALVAHGDTDLVASSVTDALRDGVSEAGSAFDELRGMVNDDGFGGGLEIPRGTSAGGSESATDSSDEFRDLLNPILFNQDAKKTAVNQIARVDDLRSSEAARDQQGFPSIDSIFGAGSRDGQSADSRLTEDRRLPQLQATEPLDPFRQSNAAPFSEPSSSSALPFSASDESDLISDMLFGDEGDASVSDSGSSSGWQDTIAKSRDQFTEGVRSEVASRAGEMASDFQGRLQESRQQAFDQTLESLEGYGARRIKESLPGPIGNLLNSGSSLTPLPATGPGQPSVLDRISDALPPELEALQSGFDPFLR